MITVKANPIIPVWVYEGLFPEADEDQLDTLAERWATQGTQLQTRGDSVQRVFRGLGSTFTGPAADAAGEKSDQVRQFLHTSGTGCAEVGRVCGEAAKLVRFAKTSINVVLLALLVQTATTRVSAMVKDDPISSVTTAAKVKQLQIVAHLAILAINTAVVGKIAALVPKVDIQPPLKMDAGTTSIYAPGTKDSVYDQQALLEAAADTGVKIKGANGPGGPAGSGQPGQPDTETADETTTGPDGVTLGPDGVVTLPDGSIIRPDGVTIRPDGVAIGPDGEPVDPNEPVPDSEPSDTKPSGDGGNQNLGIGENEVDPNSLFDSEAVTGADQEQGPAPSPETEASVNEQTGEAVDAVEAAIDSGESTIDYTTETLVNAADGGGLVQGGAPAENGGWRPEPPDTSPDGTSSNGNSSNGNSSNGGNSDSGGSRSPNGSTTNVDNMVDDNSGQGSGGGHANVSASTGGDSAGYSISVDTGYHSNGGDTGGYQYGGNATGNSGGYHGSDTGGNNSSGSSGSSGNNNGSSGSGGETNQPPRGTESAGYTGGTQFGGSTGTGTVNPNPIGSPGGGSTPLGGGSLGGGSLGGGSLGGGSLGGGSLGGGSLGGGTLGGGSVGGSPGGLGGGLGAPMTPPAGGVPGGGAIGGGAIGGAAPPAAPGAPAVPGGQAVPGGSGIPGGVSPSPAVPPQQQPLQQQPNPNAVPGGAVPKQLTPPTIDRPREPDASAMPKSNDAIAPVVAMPFAGAGLAPLFQDLRHRAPLAKDLGSGRLVLPTQFGPTDAPLALLPAGLGIAYQRVLMPGEADALVTGQVTTVRGLVHPLNQVAHLRTPAELHAALGLGFSVSADDGSRQLAFDPQATSVEVLRFAGVRDVDLIVPVAADVELRADSPIPLRVRQHGRPWTGGGVAPGSTEDALIEEFEILPAVGQSVPHLAEIWRVTGDGTTEHVATFNARTGLWSNSTFAAAQVGVPAPNGHYGVLADGSRFEVTTLNDREVVLVDRSGSAPEGFVTGDDGVARLPAPMSEVTRFLGVVTIGRWHGAAVKVLRSAAGQSLIDYVDDSPERAAQLGFRQLGQGQWQQRWVPDSELVGVSSWERDYPAFAEPTSIRPVAPAPLGDDLTAVPTSSPDVAPDGIGIRS